MRTDQPINLVGAFERPVSASDEGFVAASAKRLITHSGNVYRNFAGEPVRSLVVGELLTEIGNMQPFDVLLETLSSELNTRMSKGDGQ